MIRQNTPGRREDRGKGLFGGIYAQIQSRRGDMLNATKEGRNKRSVPHFEPAEKDDVDQNRSSSGCLVPNRSLRMI